jgi:hypothetical protein
VLDLDERALAAVVVLRHGEVVDYLPTASFTHCLMNESLS